MSSVVFNSFKQRYLNGEVPHDDVWKFIPVNKLFTQKFGQDEFPLEQYRDLNDFYKHDSSAMDNSYFEGIRRDIFWYKPADTDEIHKPMFITSGSLGEKGKYDKRSNWEDFQQTVYMQDISSNSSISSYLASGGFYYIRTKDELRWFAARANTGNNRIIGVLGDGIDGVIRGQIGADENYPFQGVFDGNGHTMNDLAIVCDNDDNGIVGVLGQDGVVKNFRLKNSKHGVNLLCEKRIDINHIKNDGRDINAGILVGRNYGRIENIDASTLESFKFSGFVPQVYSVTNKADDYKDFYKTVRQKYDNGENFYYLNSWCINSPGNICPYVGYFAEGLFAQSARGFSKDENGNIGVAAIEYAPALKSKYNAGLCDVHIDFSQSCSELAIYIKYNNKSPAPTGRTDIWQDQRSDVPWGTNGVLFLSYTTTDEKGKKVKYVVEINCTCYDKKSGTGKRRYHLHAGHYNYKQDLKMHVVGPDDEDPYASAKYDDEACFMQAYVDGSTKYYLPLLKVFDNGDVVGEEEFQELADEDFEISDDDIRVFSEDGVPAKITAKNITSIYQAPRNLDVSSAVWSTIFYRPSFRGGKIDFVYIDTQNVSHNYHVNVENKAWTEKVNPGDEDVDDDEKIYYLKKVISNLKVYDEEGNEVSRPSGNVFDKLIANKIADDLQVWQFTEWQSSGGATHYSGTVICDEDDDDFWEDYFRNRTKNGDKLWDWLEDDVHQYDFVKNNDDAKRSEATIDAVLLTLSRFQYRPFVHAEPSFNTTTKVGKTSVMVNAGSTLGVIQNWYMSQNGNDEEAAKSDAIARISQCAKQYIDNPNYYGMDRNGLWTTNCLRPDPEDDSWKSLTANRESWNSTLNFNWNLMQSMFDTGHGWFDEMKKYAELDDGLDPAYYDKDLDFADEWYEDADTPHALLNKPIRMHNMARAAYYVSPIAGANYGRIRNVIVSSTRENVGNFVGFVGSLAGKQERGAVQSAHVYAEDNFTYWQDAPVEPTRDPYVTEEDYLKAVDKYQQDLENYNFQVRYKQTPIMPSAVSEAVQSLGDNPDDDVSEWYYYPASVVDLIDDAFVKELLTIKPGTTNVLTEHSGFYIDTYLADYGAKMYADKETEYIIERENGASAKYKVQEVTQNPNYIFEKRFWECSKPMRDFTSAWYDDYKTTATEHYDDVITFALRPIFNAGGLFGKIVPTYNMNKIELTGGSVTGTQISNVDVHYVLKDPTPQRNIDTEGKVQYNTKDIHDTYGAIAGLVDFQTSEVGRFSNGIKNAVNLTTINISAEGNTTDAYPITPFGFFYYQPTEINSVRATYTSPRQKNGDHCGEYTDTTWAFDAPISVNNVVHWSMNNYAQAAVNQSSAAFFDIASLTGSNLTWGVNKPEVAKQYMQKISEKVFLPISGVNGFAVNCNTDTLAYCNPAAIDIFKSGRGIYSIQSVFGSNTLFEPAMPSASTGNMASAAQECLIYGKTRFYSMNREPLSAHSQQFHKTTEYTPVNVDCLRDPGVFHDNDFDDLYFDYTYSSTTSFVDDWTFTHNVIFTSALKDKDAGKPVTMNEKATLGYVFRDPHNYSADGFWYNYNYLHIGNSVSPKYIREQTKVPGSVLHTSACSGAYYNEDGELVSANGNHAFGGLLVLDGNDRTVMFIDNISGAKIDGGTWNLACEPCTYQNSRGGLLLEVK